MVGEAERQRRLALDASGGRLVTWRVSGDGVEIVTRTPELPELEAGGFARPGITLV
jgi:hypothetical protein